MHEQAKALRDLDRKCEPPANVAHAGDRLRKRGRLGVERVEGLLLTDRLGEAVADRSRCGGDLFHGPVLEDHGRHRELVEHRLGRVGERESAPRLHGAVQKVLYLLEHYGKHPAWLKVNGKPVLFVYGRAVGEIKADGWLKVQQGQTTVEELLRVVQE